MLFKNKKDKIIEVLKKRVILKLYYYKRLSKCKRMSS